MNCDVKHGRPSAPQTDIVDGVKVYTDADGHCHACDPAVVGSSLLGRCGETAPQLAARFLANAKRGTP